MMQGAARSGFRARFALLLVACALLMRIAVPAGWMPQAHAGAVTLSWCHDSDVGGPAALAEAKAMIADAVGAPEPEAPRGDQPCAFAAAAQPVAPVETPALALSAILIENAAPIAPEIVPGRGLAAPPPRSTGPPRLA